MNQPYRLPNDELLKIKAELEAEEIDDSESLLIWFVEHGPELIDELLAARKGAIHAPLSIP